MENQPVNQAQQPLTPNNEINNQPANVLPKKSTDGLSIAAIILAFFIPIVGLILGIIAKVKSKNAGQKNTLATAAIIISSVIIVFVFLGFIFLFSALFNKCSELGPGVHYEDGVTYTCS
ncbi:DUF4190 domain-containing protein [Candidatus Saccharibacteria bacterium]|nr:DUF4190 domain-containing protein [Candidatus Saccharibacteria bacterium]